ncbi:Receptor-like protein kinase FERONIA [Morella rubra]|uniref:Receptor-like protein kinase FERONIA n=1 Tax=Morella rubra TaxID=262757 RepID=A0A6A1VK62_9ROSI|nr:Receptor-like protein kinase FERONIA [Morella rubra]
MLDKIVDPFLKGKITPECLNKFGEVAVNCLLDEGIKRPTMDDVVGGLEFALQLQESAKDPRLFTTSSEDVSDSKSSSVIMTSSGDENSTNEDSD